MALFKILKGNEANLPSTKHEGWAYVTEKGNMYVDLSNDKRVKIGNRADTAEYADKATGDTQTIRSRYLARIKQVTSDGTQFTFRGETGDGTNAPDLISIPLAGDKAGLVSNAAQTIKGEKTFVNGIKFPDVTSTTYPAASAGLTWYGSTDGAKIYYEVQASDKGMLIIEARDDTNAGAIFRNSNSKKEVSIINGLVTGTFKGNLSGTASHATSDANGKNIASYVASVLAQSDNRTIRVTKGDGTTNDVKLYFAASSSFGGAANSANVLNINNTESIGVGRMQFFQKSGDATLMPDTDWWSLVRLQHGGYASTGYWTEMAYAFHSDTIKFRRNQNGTKSAWKTIAFTDGTIAKATQAEKDWLGQVIDETYMKYPLSISGEVITMTRGDGVSSTITVPDTKVTQSETTTANYRPIILGYTNTTDTTKLSASTRNQVYASTKFYAQPSTGTLVATIFKGALDGNAKTATNATYAEKAKGDTATIRSTYVSSVAKNGVKVVVKKGDGTSNEFQLDFLPLAGGTMVGNIAFSKDNVIQWSRNTDFAKIGFKNDSDADANSYMYFHTGDNGNEYFKFRITSGSTVTDVLNIKNGAATFNGTVTATKFIGALQGTADYADKAKGDTTTIRSTYVKSVAKKSGSNYVFTVSKGDGTTNNVDLYFAASASCGGAALSANILNAHSDSNITTRGGDAKLRYSYGITKTATGLFAASDNANAILTINKHNGSYDSQLGFSSDGNIYYRSFDGSALNTTTGWKTVAFTDGKIKNAEFADKATGDSTTIRSTYVKSVAKNGVKVVVKKGDGTSNEFQLDFLPLAGGTMTGNVTFNNETQSIYKIARKKNGGGGWAYAPIRFTGSDNVTFANIGAFGSGNTFNYLYIGAGDYDAATNLRIYPSGNVSAKKFIGALEGTADYANKAKGDTVSIRSKYVSSVLKKSGSNYVLRITKGDGTVNDVDLYFAASSSCGGDANQAIKTKDLGTHTEAASGTTANAPTTGMLYSSGMYMTRTYNDTNTPCNFGNIINVAGAGTGQLLLGWSGNDNTTGDIYYRSHRDTSTGGWSPWKRVAFTDGKIKNAEFADKAKGDTTTIRSTYVKSVVKKSGSNYVFTVSKGDGTTNNVDLYFAASASCGGAALSANILNGYAESNITTRGGDGKLRYSYNIVKTATGLFAANNNANAILTINKHGGNYDSQLGFSSDGNIYYRSFNGSALNTTTGWKTIAFTDGKIKSAEFADKATGDSTTIRSTYIASIKQVTSDGTTFTFRGYAGDGTERANLITIPSASTSKAGLVTTAAQTWAGNKTFNGDIYISHNTVQSMAYNTTNPKLVFSENGGQPVGLVYTDYDTYRSPAGLKVMSTVSNNEKAWFEVEGDLYVGRNLYDKEHNILLASKYVAQLIGSQGSTNYTITPKNQEGTTLSSVLNVPINLVGSGNTSSKIFLVGTTSQNAKAQTGYSHDTVFIDSDGFLYDSGNKPSYHSKVSVGNTNNYKYHRIARTNEITSSWHDGTILLYISQDYNGGSYGLLRISLRTNDISSTANASLEGEWITRSGFALNNFKLALYSAAKKVYADLYYVSPGTYAGITVKQIQQGSRSSLNQSRWFLTDSSEVNNTTTSNKKTSTSYKDIAAAQTGLRGGVAYTLVADTVDASRVNNANYADRAQYDWNGNDIRKKYIATLAVKTTNGTTFTFKGSSMEGDELSAITVPAATASIAGLVTNGAQTWAGNKTLNNDLYIKGKVAVSASSTNNYNLYVNGTSYFVKDARFKTEIYLEARGAYRLLYSDSNRKIMTGSHYANSTQVGINTTNTTNIGSYNLFVEGTAKFNGNTYHNGVDYFANGTTYYINNSAHANLRAVGSSDNTFIMYPQGGGFRTSEATKTGYLKITLPQSWTNTMMSFKIQIYEYQTGYSCEYVVGGYNYSSTWANRYFAYSTGKNDQLTHSNLTVRFGHDGSKCAIYIGESNTSWSYPQVQVHSMIAGYSNYGYDKWASGWKVGFTTSLGTVTAVVEKPHVSYRSSQVYVTNTNSNTSMRLYFGYAGSSYRDVYSDENLTYNPGTNTLYCANIIQAPYIYGTTHGYFGNYNNTSYSLSTASFISNDWVRTNGSTGWYSQTYGGGIHMTDSTWVRTYNNKSFYCSQIIQAGARIYTGWDSGNNGSVSCSNWFRSKGSTGWYNQTYNGGIYMTDSTFVRVSNSKRFKTDNAIHIYPTEGNYSEGLRIYSYGSWSDILLCGNDMTATTGTSANSWFIGNNNGTFNIVRNGSSTGTAYLRCVSNKWYINTTTGGEQLNVGGWVGTVGNAGWYSLTHGGGWYMTDTSWVRSYNNKGVYTGGEMQAGTIRANSALRSQGHALIYSNSNNAAYTSSAIEIREYNVAGAQTGAWSEAPSLTFHWSGRVQRQIRLHNNGWLYCTNDNFSTAHRLVLENGGSWNIKANTAGTSDWANYLVSNNRMAYGWNGLNYFNASMSASGTAGKNNSPTTDWYHIIRMNHANSGGYYCDIATCFHNNNMYLKRVANGSSSGWLHIWVQGNAVTSAVWNDYAECRKSDSQEPGYVMFEKGDDSLSKTIERLQHFAGIVSDTWGFSQGETADAKTNIAVAGRVLAYPYRDRNEYKPGDCVCAAPGGKVDIMTREEIVQYPDRIVGTVSCVPEYEEWGGGEGADRDPVKVNGRIWIKVK